MGGTVNVGKWEVPKDLYDEYLKFRVLADTYAENKAEYPGKGMPYGDFERMMRWQICVTKVAQIHKMICEAVGVIYRDYMHNDGSEADEFYRIFMDMARRDVRLHK